MSIYTKGGDKGTTGTLAGDRVRKDSPVVQANGAIDELNSALGVVRAALARSPHGAWAPLVGRVQRDLFSVGAFVSSGQMTYLDSVGTSAEEMERAIDDLFQGRVLDAFVIPGETLLDSWCHMARTACRRAERSLVALDNQDGVAQVLPWINRLSDLLFALAWFVADQGD